MKKTYDAPTMDIEKFEIEDIITTSGGNGPDLDQDELPPM